MEQITLARVALSAATYAIDKPYTYSVPAELAARALPGVRVIVPFGAGNRRTEGLILAVETVSTADPRCKAVLTLLDDYPVLDSEGLRLALWMRERYFCTVYDAARAMLPAGLYFSLQDRYRLADGVDRERAYEAAGSSKGARTVVEMVCSLKWVELGKIKAAFGAKDPGPALRRLTERGILVLETSASRGVGDKVEQIARLAMPAEDALAQVAPRRRSAPMRYAVTQLLCTVGEASVKELCYFTGASGQTIRSLEKSHILELEQREVYRRAVAESAAPAEPVVLNEEQQAAFEGLDELARRKEPAAALLYGVTGSGKTQVYIRLIEEALKSGQGAMVLVPEIALTPQMLHSFTAQFGSRVAVLHSLLRAGERYDEWKRVRSGQADVVIGTRSAVFAPIKNLGIIILDEEQEGSYKSENVPKYHAREVAKFRCRQHGALLVLGSATPSIESMYLAKTGVYALFQLKNRYNRKCLPEVEIADLRQELREGNGGAVSRPLADALAEAMERGEQSILFLNRRGASRMVSCGECGEVPVCPRCSVYLTYHSANGRLMCHYCGHSERVPECCPHCGGTLTFLGVGTQKVQEELEARFPGREILRMDADTVSATHSHEALLSRFEKDKIPVLVGTQMVAKGLDFEGVTLAGVVAADLSLYVDDYRGAERTFSLLTQVVGRAGRGGRTGRAVIQTYTPENDVIAFAAAQNYDGFYEQEIELRRLRGCPPFRDLFLLTASGTEESAVLQTCMRLRRSLEDWLRRPEFRPYETQILGPAPAPVAKVNNRYRYRLTLSGKNDKTMRALVAHLLRCAQADKKNRGVAVHADINPLD